MRRFILIVVMCLLPLQWSWAAAARVCEHEQGAVHFGHHGHQHSGGAEASDGDAGASAYEALQPHPDCHTCHGMGVGYLPAIDAPHWERPDRFSWRDGGQAFPEPPPGSLLRPPSFLVA